MQAAVAIALAVTVARKPAVRIVSIWLCVPVAAFLDAYLLKGPLLGLLGASILLPWFCGTWFFAARKIRVVPAVPRYDRSRIGACVLVLPLSLLLAHLHYARLRTDLDALGADIRAKAAPAATRLDTSTATSTAMFPAALDAFQRGRTTFKSLRPGLIEVDGVQVTYLLSDDKADAALVYWNFGWLTRVAIDVATGTAQAVPSD